MILLFFAAVVAGSIASVTGFGIGSLLTPIFALQVSIILAVDGARMPVYFIVSGRELVDVARPIAIATLGVVIGTSVGTRALSRLPPRVFRQIIGVMLLALGCYMIARG